MPTIKSDSLIGKTVAGRFRIIDHLGQGGMGKVYLAEHETLPRRFAIKILKNEYLSNELFVERFRREAIASSRVVHPNVVYITDFGRLPEGSFYIVMEFLEGMGLDALLESQGRIPVSRALPILVQVADALDHAHKMGVIHRDLKAENVLLVEERNRRDIVKILDFGIARLMVPDCTNSRITAHGQVFGTPEYMSPEQAADKPLDGRSDIYSLGVLAFELVTGQPPFMSPNASEVLTAHISQPSPPPSALVPDAHIPRLFDGLVLRCLSKKPAHRYETAGEVRADLLRVQNALRNVASRMAQLPETSGDFTDIPTRQPSRASSGAPLGSLSVTELRGEYHKTLVELTLRLVSERLLDVSYSRIIDEVFQFETELSAFAATIALKEQEFEQIRVEYRDREKHFRYAIMDLAQELRQLSVMSTLMEQDSVQKDLNFQIETLQGRLVEIDSEKRNKIRTLNDELVRYRTLSEELENKNAQRIGLLIAAVEQLRNQDREALRLRFGTLFEKLDRIRTHLDWLRRQDGPVN